MEKQVENPDCSDLVAALEKQYKLLQQIAFYFIPREVMEQVIECSQETERLIKKYKL